MDGAHTFRGRRLVRTSREEREALLAVGSWGAYKNVKVTVRVILDVDVP